MTSFLLATWIVLTRSNPLHGMLAANFQSSGFGFGIRVNGFKVLGGYSSERGGRLMIYDRTYRIWVLTGGWISCGDGPKARWLGDDD